jgi:hypothetical protein
MWRQNEALGDSDREHVQFNLPREELIMIENKIQKTEAGFGELRTLKLLFAGGVMLVISILGVSLASLHADQPRAEVYWSELIASMDKMHMTMEAIQQSGNADADFVKLMLPHHQAAIDMAKTQLLYGKDAQMRRLAQEIITDQQLEIELMQRWLKQRESASTKEGRTPASESKKGN